MKWCFHNFQPNLFEPVVAIIFLVLFFWANLILSLLKIWSSIIFHWVTCFINFHDNICIPSYDASELIVLITWEVIFINNFCLFMNWFNHTIFKYPADRFFPYNTWYISFPFRKIMSWVTGYPWLYIPINQSTKSE